MKSIEKYGYTVYNERKIVLGFRPEDIFVLRLIYEVRKKYGALFDES